MQARINWAAAAMLLAIGAAAPAAAQPSGSVIKDPDWLKKPSAQDLAAVWPAKARANGVRGRAIIACEVTQEGTLRKCAVVSETPPGSGYGYAALALAPQFRMRPKTVDGQPVAGGTVRIPITFEPGGTSRGAPRGGVGHRYVTTPNWIAAPARSQVAAVYPRTALARKQAGRATLDCAVAADGALRSCEVAEQDPKAAGFGPAALSLAPLFRIEPLRDAQGEPIENVHVRLPVVFSPAIASEAGEQIAKPEWGRLPEGPEVAALYPPKAKAARATGSATIECSVAHGGTLRDCSVARETPADMGFGEAALRLAPHFRMRGWTSDGRPVDGARVRIPIAYRDPE